MIKICSFCGKKFECYDKSNYRGGRKTGMRKKNSICCSPKCSKEWSRKRQLKKWKKNSSLIGG
jgi:hypothetical protein